MTPIGKHPAYDETLDGQILNPWFHSIELQFTLTHLFTKNNDGYIVGHKLLIPNATNQSHLPPPGALIFFTSQFKGGLHLSIPPIYLALLSFFNILVNQVASNYFHILTRIIIIFTTWTFPYYPSYSIASTSLK